MIKSILKFSLLWPVYAAKLFYQLVARVVMLFFYVFLLLAGKSFDAIGKHSKNLNGRKRNRYIGGYHIK